MSSLLNGGLSKASALMYWVHIAALYTIQYTSIEFCDRSTTTGQNKQKGFMQMLAGAMSALRNPKAHSNAEQISEEEAFRRLATASMLMYAIDDAVKHSGIKE